MPTISRGPPVPRYPRPMATVAPLVPLVGIARPFRMGPADLSTVAGDDLRRTRVEQVFATRASSAGETGELAWDPTRGSRIDALRNAAASPAIADLAAFYCQDALAQALPDEQLRTITVLLDAETIELRAETQAAADATPHPKRVPAVVRVAR